MLNDIDCCGIKEHYGFDDRMRPNDRLSRIYRQLRNAWQDDDEDDGRFHAAFVLFSAVTRQRSAEPFIRYLKSQNLGNVVETQRNRNPNTGAKLKAWIWEIDPKAFELWYKEQQK